MWDPEIQVNQVYYKQDYLSYGPPVLISSVFIQRE